MSAKNKYLGMDGGASKLLVQSIIIEENSNYASMGDYCQEISYNNFDGWDKSFKPADLKTQKIISKKNKIVIPKNEKNQGNIIIDIISESYHNAIKVIGPISGVGLCFPGIKTSDMTGTIVMANGPRIPNFCKKLLERNIPINILYNDSDCCVLGELQWQNGSLKNIDRAVYIGGGTGIADGLIINGQVVNFNLDSYLKKSWELILPSGKTVESALSPKFLIENYNMINPKNSVNTLNEIILEADNNNPYAIEIVEHAVIALHFLIENRLKYINEKTGKNCQKIIVGQRLGIALSLKNGRNSFMKNILSKIDVPLSISNERKTAALGAAWKSSCF